MTLSLCLVISHYESLFKIDYFSKKKPESEIRAFSDKLLTKIKAL